MNTLLTWLRHPLRAYNHYRRYKLLKGTRPLTVERIAHLAVGDTILLIKRNRTTDYAALYCHLDSVVDANMIGEWKVIKHLNHGAVVFESKRDPNNRIILGKGCKPEFKRFNYLYIKPQLFQDEMHIRAYYYA